MPTDPDPLTQLLGAARASDTTQLHVLHRGVELASVDGSGEALSTVSVTKLIVGTIIGPRAVRLRLFDLDDPVYRSDARRCHWSY